MVRALLPTPPAVRTNKKKKVRVKPRWRPPDEDSPPTTTSLYSVMAVEFGSRLGRIRSSRRSETASASVTRRRLRRRRSTVFSTRTDGPCSASSRCTRRRVVSPRTELSSATVSGRTRTKRRESFFFGRVRFSECASAISSPPPAATTSHHEPPAAPATPAAAAAAATSRHVHHFGRPVASSARGRTLLEGSDVGGTLLFTTWKHQTG